MNSYYQCKICDSVFYKNQVNRHFKSHGITPKEYYKKFINKSTGICKFCGKKTEFLGLHQGFREYCSVSCATSDQRNKNTDKIMLIRRNFYNDLDFIQSLLKKECNTCDPHKNRCEDCPFIFNRDGKVYFNADRYRLSNRYHVKMHYFFYFIYYSDLDWKLPPQINDDEQWNLHHRDHNHWNNRKRNLTLITRSKHRSIHMAMKFNPNSKKHFTNLNKLFESLKPGRYEITQEITTKLGYYRRSQAVSGIKNFISQTDNNAVVTDNGKTNRWIKYYLEVV